MADNKNTLRAIAEHIARIFEPLAEAVGDDDAFFEFLLRLGWQAGNRPGSFASLASEIAAAVNQIGALQDEPSPSDVFNALSSLRQLYTDLQHADVPSGIQATAVEIAQALVEMLLVDYLSSTTPRLFEGLRITGVVKVEDKPASGSRGAYVRTSIEWGRIVDVAEDPKKITQGLYGWGTADFQFDHLIENLAELLRALQFNPRLAFASDEERVGYRPPGNPLSKAIERELVIPFASAMVGADLLEARVSVLELPGRDAEPPGMIVELALPQLPNEILLRKDLRLQIAPDPAITGPAGVFVRSGQPLSFRSPLGSGAALGVPKLVPKLTFAPPTPFLLLGGRSGTRLQLGGASLSLALLDGPALSVDFVPVDLKLVLSGGDSDGFLGSLIGSGREVKFDTGLRWNSATGISFLGRAQLSLDLALNLSLGPLHVSALSIQLLPPEGSSADGFQLAIGSTFDATLGPVSVSVEHLGVKLDFLNTPGSMGPFDVDAGLKAPTGLGISIDAGSVSGGGFISFDEPNGRYFGALELSVYGVAVKAFGIIETKFPDGHKGFSFLIIISAEFTPIQLGLGFTLNGVGGLAGINRTVDAKGLLDTIRAGHLENVLFPHDVVHDAPAIVHDVGVLFPPAQGHYVFGPLAKIGWGTPTLVEAELGLILDLPGPRLVILGTVHAALPTKEEALVELNLDVGGVLDFPKKSFALDASLHDSHVGDYPVSGDMSMRLTWGDRPNFALAVGGFNPHFNPPPSFPKLRPVTVDLGQHGNPSVNLAGYFALTSNTAQVGALLEARVSRSGAELYGFLGFDALFVFSPFSFMADIEGGVSVKFHGHGFSLHFHGHVSGPSPWHLDGQVCVSILFWDACVGFSMNLGGESKASLPGLDPWVGSPVIDGKQQVIGLKPALENAANWAGGAPTGSFSVVTLVAAPPGTSPPIDPLGTATVRQKSVPLDLPISRFAGAKPSMARTFNIEFVTIGEVRPDGTVISGTTTNDPTRVSDLFAPAEFQAMKDADRLSSPSFVQLHAGFTVSSDALDFGTRAPKAVVYDTWVFGPNGTQTQVPVTPAAPAFRPTQDQVGLAALRGSSALGGIRAAALSRFLDPTALPKVKLLDDGYVLSSISNLKVSSGFDLTKPVPRPVAVAALRAALTTDPTAFQTMQVTPFYNARP